MAKLVIDASIAVKWFVDEEHAHAARRLRTDRHELLVPAHMPAEVANAIWSKRRRGQLHEDQVGAILFAIEVLPVRQVQLRYLLRPAMDLAVRYDRTVYDALYVALALRERCRLVTADLRLYNTLTGALPETMAWIGDVALA